MSDSKIWLDRNRISLEQDYEVRDWARSLGVSEQELRASVEVVGNSAAKVKEHLHRGNAPDASRP